MLPVVNSEKKSDSASEPASIRPKAGPANTERNKVEDDEEDEGDEEINDFGDTHNQSPASNQKSASLHSKPTFYDNEDTLEVDENTTQEEN